MVFDHVRQTISIAIGSPGKASGLTEQAVKDLTNRLPHAILDLLELLVYVVAHWFILKLH